MSEGRPTSRISGFYKEPVERRVALLAHTLGQPVIVDPSHAAGRRDLIAPLARAALAVGAAGLMIETHDDPARALSDGPQAVPAGEMAALVQTVTGRTPNVD